MPIPRPLPSVPAPSKPKNARRTKKPKPYELRARGETFLLPIPETGGGPPVGAFRDAMKAADLAAKAITGASALQRHLALAAALDAALAFGVAATPVYRALGLTYATASKVRRVRDTYALVRALALAPDATRIDRLGLGAIDLIGEVSRWLKKSGRTDHDDAVTALINDLCDGMRLAAARKKHKPPQPRGARTSLRSEVSTQAAAAPVVGGADTAAELDALSAEATKEHKALLASVTSEPTTDAPRTIDVPDVSEDEIADVVVGDDDGGAPRATPTATAGAEIDEYLDTIDEPVNETSTASPLSASPPADVAAPNKTRKKETRRHRREPGDVADRAVRDALARHAAAAKARPKDEDIDALLVGL